jgi:CheY-like chemotaxis protein
VKGGILFVDDDRENVAVCAEILAETSGRPVEVVETVEDAMERLHHGTWSLVVMDLFIPLGEHPHRMLGRAARRFQEHVDHLGGLVLLEEIEKLPRRPVVLSHTACTDHVLLALFGDRVAGRIPKPAPLDTVLHDVLEAVRALPEDR